MKENEEKTWGGSRPGSGRKTADPKEKRVQVVITVSRKTKERLDWLKRYRSRKPGRIMDYLLEKHWSDL